MEEDKTGCAATGVGSSLATSTTGDGVGSGFATSTTGTGNGTGASTTCSCFLKLILFYQMKNIKIYVSNQILFNFWYFWI